MDLYESISGMSFSWFHLKSTWLLISRRRGTNTKMGKRTKILVKFAKTRKPKSWKNRWGNLYSENRKHPEFDQLDHQGTGTEEGGQTAVGTVLQWHLKRVSTGEVHLLGEQDEREDPSGEIEDVIYLWFVLGFCWHFSFHVFVLYRLTLSSFPWGNAGGSSQQAFKHQGRLDPRHPWHLPIFQRLEPCFLVRVAQAARKILPRRHERRQQTWGKKKLKTTTLYLWFLFLQAALELNIEGMEQKAVVMGWMNFWKSINQSALGP